MISSRALSRSALRRQTYTCAQCLRHQSRSQSTKPPAQADAEHIRKSIMMQQTQPMMGIPEYPTSQNNKKPAPKSEAQDDPVHPALMGFIVGALTAGGCCFLMYYFTGSAQIVRHQDIIQKTLNVDRMRMFVHPGLEHARDSKLPEVEGTAAERIRWFERCAMYYAAYVVGANAYVESVVPDILAARRECGEDFDLLLDKIVIECAKDLQKEIKGGEMGMIVGQNAWAIMHRHLEKAAELAEQERFVPLEIKQRVEAKIEALKKMGTKIGRIEKRAMLDKETSKA